MGLMKMGRAVLGVLVLTMTSVYARPYAFITNQIDDTVSVIDVEQRSVIEIIPVTGKPVGVAVNDFKKQVYISVPNGGGFVVLDQNQMQPSQRIAVGGASLGITIDAQGERVFVADWYENTITVFDTATFKKLREIKGWRSVLIIVGYMWRIEWIIVFRRSI